MAACQGEYPILRVGLNDEFNQCMIYQQIVYRKIVYTNAPVDHCGRTSRMDVVNSRASASDIAGVILLTSSIAREDRRAGAE